MASTPFSTEAQSVPGTAGEAPAAAPSQPRRDVTDYELLFDCVHCGLCLEACPTYIVTRAEMDSPRGRVYLMKALAEGKLELDADAVRHLDACLGCRGCETACPSGVRYGRLIEGAREYVEKNYRRGWRARARNQIIAALFPYPRRLRILIAPLRLLELLRLRPMMERLAPPGMRRWLELVPPRSSDHQTNFTGSVTTLLSDSPTVAVHHGCVTQVLTEPENLNCERLLAAAGYRVVRLAGAVCCGALDRHHGNLERARDFARQNVRAIAASGASAIVSVASGCSAALATYGELLKEDRELANTAREVAARVADLSSLMLAREVRFTKEFPTTVTYHDSCHLVHGLGVRDEPRRLLRSIPGVRLIEMEEADVCCGSAGSYNLTEPKMARELARRKAAHIIATGADYVVMSNPGCEFQLAAELKRTGARTRVIHLVDFLALAMTGK
ncbi:MAG: (Fe-S)-binding protein [Candidatus Binataceae bacterium]